ncbi:DUF4395 family protein [Pseudorhodoferax sp.]|jgi:hypothetical protein|uniref:DUF4395 family protein n=1 Tax=Pseudorhodoferax sp. TaxID=1993553 RepID=UPI002DD63CC4|nr:DUF4395 family protein [Pseudorhodoferax sp.]
MLRFDLPRVHANVVRWEALLTCLVCLLALRWSPWLMAVLALQGGLRGWLGHHREPLHALWKRILQAQGWAGPLEDVGAKMFAAKLLCIASSVALLLAAAGSTLWRVPVAVLVVFSTLEWALAFCAGCWAYGWWYRRFPPA